MRPTKIQPIYLTILSASQHGPTTSNARTILGPLDGYLVIYFIWWVT